MLDYWINYIVHVFRSTKNDLLFSCSFNSVTGYNILGELSYSKSIFKIQKRIRVIMTSGRKVSCRELFKQLNILPLQSQYIFSLLLFIIKNRDKLLSNSEVRNINTRYNTNLHLPLANLTIYQKGFFFMQEVGFIIICHQSSRTYQMMRNVSKQL